MPPAALDLVEEMCQRPLRLSELQQAVGEEAEAVAPQSAQALALAPLDAV